MFYVIILFCAFLAFFKNILKYITSTKVRITVFLKYRFYGITGNLNYPKPFEVFTYN